MHKDSRAIEMQKFRMDDVSKWLYPILSANRLLRDYCESSNELTVSSLVALGTLSEFYGADEMLFKVIIVLLEACREDWGYLIELLPELNKICGTDSKKWNLVKILAESAEANAIVKTHWRGEPLYYPNKRGLSVVYVLKMLIEAAIIYEDDFEKFKEFVREGLVDRAEGHILISRLLHQRLMLKKELAGS